MAFINREFRLTNEPGGRGLSCSSAGLSLAGVPLLSGAATGFAPRPAAEIAALMRAAYGSDVSSAAVSSGLATVARALNRGDLAHATISAVLMRLPELSPEAAARLAKAEESLRKYDPDQARDWHGRWTSGEGTQGARSEEAGQSRPPSNENATNGGAAPTDPAGSRLEADSVKPEFKLAPVGFATPQDDKGNLIEVLQTLYPLFASKYDDLPPVEFAKKVIEFGDWLGRDGRSLSSEDREIVLAEYVFLQNRLSSWLKSDDNSIEAHGNLVSAALTLFNGAVNGGLITVGGKVGGLPQSMEAVAGLAAGLDSGPPKLPPRLPSIKPAIENGPVTPPDWRKPGERGGMYDNDKVGIGWGQGNKQQGMPWNSHGAADNPNIRVLPPGAKTFDLLDESTGEALSRKTLFSPGASYSEDPSKVYARLKGYVDAAADYEPRPNSTIDLQLSEIKSRTVDLAVPRDTTPVQWVEINRAALYGRSRGVDVVTTTMMGPRYKRVR